MLRGVRNWLTVMRCKGKRVITVGDPTFPVLQHVGLSGLMVSFARQLSEPANRAALAFRQAVDQAGIVGIEESATSLVSVFFRIAPDRFDAVQDRVSDLLATQNWFQTGLPFGRRLWQVPTVYGTDLAPQFEEAAAAAGLSPDAALRDLSTTRVRVLTIGFAPGQPYLGTLGQPWDIPRQTALTPRVPPGALVVALRQFVLFSAETPTGWRHVGQTAFRCFRPDAAQPFALAPGDEMLFEPVSPKDYVRIVAQDGSGNGGATCNEIAA